MTAVALFENGTPLGRGAALAQYQGRREAFHAAEQIVWHVDVANLGLLSRGIAELGSRGREANVQIVLAAEDLSPTETIVLDEGAIVPTLQRLGASSDAPRFELRMSNGRRYHLPPPALDISTNDLCGLACSMCNNRNAKRDPETMPASDVRGLMTEAADWGIRRVALTGAGEPFRDPEMLDHIRFANALGHLVTITTNGFPISEKVAEILAGSVISVSVSIHGASDEMHDRIVGVPKAAERAWSAVRRMVAARKPGSKLSVNVSTVIQRENLLEIPGLVRRAREAGCDGINIQPVNLQHGAITDGGTIERRDDLVSLSRHWPRRDDDVGRVFDELVHAKRELGRFVHTSVERLELFRRYFADSSKASLGVGCRVGEAFLAVDHRGRIKPCYRLPWSLGDARVTRVRTLWNSLAYAETRKLIDACPLTCMNNCFFRAARASS